MKALTRKEMEYSNRRQREVFGFSDEDLENEDQSRRMFWASVFFGAMIVLVVLFA